MVSLAQMFGSGHGYMGTNNNNTEMTNDESLIYQNGHLQSGPLTALIQHLVPTNDYTPDKTYTFAFLLSSRLFIRPHELLAQVCKLCVMQRSQLQDCLHNHASRPVDNYAPNVDNHAPLDKFGLHLVSLLSEWTDMFPYDFRCERMMKQLRDVTQRLLASYPDLRKEINNLSYNLVTKLTKVKSYEETLTKLQISEQERMDNQELSQSDVTEACPSPLVMAQQLTRIELERISMIGPEEFVQALTKDSGSLDDVTSDHLTSDNLENYVQWFNRLTNLVATEITSHLKKKKRVAIVEYFIEVAKECINIGNFNSLMAIIAGINLSPVSRLKKTWAKVNRDKLQILEHQMDPSNNFNSYRSCLKAAVWRCEGAGQEREKIVIPFFSIFVKDLYFLNEGYPSRQQDGTVNFHKCWHMAKQVSHLVAWQQVQCPFEKNHSVLNYVLTAPVYTESMLSLASYECENPDSPYDRERYKQLKLELTL